MNANEMREVTAEELESVVGGSLFGDAIRKIGDFLRGPSQVNFSDVQVERTIDSPSL
jgi:hypothetical protein